MSKQTKPTTEEVTPDMINGWKQQYGKVTKYKTADGKVVFFRSPSRAEVAASQAAQQESDGLTANEVLVKACSLGGDVEILSDNKYLFGMGKHIQKFIEKVEGETEEL
jgi:hypothetical protein